MEQNKFMRILEWLFEGQDPPAKLFLIGMTILIILELARILL